MQKILSINSIVIFLVILSGFVASFLVNPLFAWFGLVAIMAGVILIGSPDRILLSYALWASISPLVMQVVGISRYMDEVFVLCCLAVLVGLRILRGKLSFNCNPFLLLCLFLLATLLATGLVNDSPKGAVVNAAVTYFAFPFIFFLSCEVRSEKSVRWFIRGAILFLLVQVALDLGWILGINPLPNRHAQSRNMLDICHGSLGRADWLAYAMICLFFLFISAARHLPKGGAFRRQVIFLLPVVLLQYRFAFTAHALLYFLLCGLFYLFLTSRSVWAFMKLLAIGVMVVAVLVFSVELARQQTFGERVEDTADLYSKRNLVRRYTIFKTAPKMQLIRKVAINWFHTAPQRWWLGMGMGNGTSVIGMSRVSPGAYDLLAEFYLTRSGVESMVGRSIMESTYSGLVSLWSEYGLIGLMAYCALYIFVFMRVYGLVRRGAYPNVHQRILAEAFLPVLLLYLGSNFLNELLFSDFWQVTIWTWAGFVFDPLPEANDGKAGHFPVEGTVPLQVKGTSDEQICERNLQDKSAN